MNQTFKRAMSLFMALAMVFSMVPSFGTHAHAEELETEPAIVTEAPATEAPVAETPVEEVPETEAPTQAPETEAPVVETEAPEVIETEAAEETEAVEETEEVTTDATEETIVEEFLEEEVVEEEAVAADLSMSVTGLTATYEEKTNVAWSANGNAITGTATSPGKARTTTANLTLTNDLGSEATLRFSWTVSDDDDKTDATLTGAIEATADASGEYEKILADGDFIKISLKSPKNMCTATLNITNISLVSTTAVDADLTFEAPSNGSYTVNDTAVTADTVMTVSAGTMLELVATPDSGYQFFGWQKNDGTYISQDAAFTLTASESMVITPVFIDAATAIFGVGTTKYDDLTEAGAAAAAGVIKTIILLNDGTVSGDHTIPAGTTLLIPYDDANTAYGESPSCTSDTSASGNDTEVAWESPTPYRTLTLAADANITVNGNIEVSGRHAAALGKIQKYGGSPTGKLGYINMLSGSHMDLNSGANLYAWGYVYGDGTITAKPGAAIYENFQVMDFRGGSATSQLASEYKFFPLSQYYVQNVEVATTYEYGAAEYIATSIFMSNHCYSATVKFIGDGAMFQPAAGSRFVKDYNPATDRLEMHAYGDSTMASMSLELSGTKIDSSDFVLPITNNIQIELHSGTTTLQQNMMLLPGSSLTVDQGATLNLAYTDVTGDVVTAGGYVLQVFDSENWTQGLADGTYETVTGLTFVHSARQFTPVAYTCTDSKIRTTADLTDVTLDINGTVVTNGYVYSTVTWADAPNEDFIIVGGGANIISSEKTGVFEMVNGAGEDMFGYMYDQAKASYYLIPLASAQLKNGGGTLVDTTGAEAGTTYIYCAACDCWDTDDHVCPSVEITWVVNGAETKENVNYNTVPAYSGAAPTKASDATNHYTFAGWATEENGTALTTLPNATADVTYYAVFTAVAHSTADDGDCTTEVKCSCGYVVTAAKTAHAYTVELSKTAATCMATGSVIWKCANCDKSTTETLAIDPTNHTGNNTTGVNAKAATCTDAGYTGDTVCECGVTVTTGSTIDAKGHTFGETTAAKAATCLAAGNAAYKQCETCKLYFAADAADNSTAGKTDTASFVIAKKAHSYTGAIKSNGNGEDATHSFLCVNGCNQYGGTVAHSWDDGEQTTAPGCESEGVTTYTCTVFGCRATYTVADEKLGHGHTKGVEYKSNSNNTHRVTCLDCSKQTVAEEACTFVNHVCEKCDAVERMTITFMDGDEVYGTFTVTYNKPANFYGMPAPVDDGYHWAGWFTKDGKELVAGDVVTENLTVYATQHAVKWVEAKDATCTEDGNIAHYYCADCDKNYEYIEEYKDYTVITESVVIEKLGHNHTNTAVYTDLGDGNHSIACGDCKAVTTTSEAHDFDNDEHKCVCGAVETFTITWSIDGVETPVQVTFNTLPEAPVATKAADDNFTYDFKSWDKEIVAATEDATYTAIFVRTGWLITENGAQYLVKDEVQKSGWTMIGDAWYYLDPDTGYRAEGIARVPYPTETINGVTYEPNAEDLKYAEDHNTTFLDKDEAWFVFGDDGKFLSDYSGPANTQNELISWAANGQIVWHVGVAKLAEDTYAYFIGDEVNGGNIMATGDVYVSRVCDNVSRSFVIGGIYTFGEDGILCKYDGITDMADGTKRYYEDAQLMVGNGLTKVGDNYIYVRSNGTLVVSGQYWIGTNKLNIATGMYSFDENGYMIDPVDASVNGVVNGYYYVNGRTYYAGLIEYNGGIIYVTSSGKLATGKYYVTKTNDMEGYPAGFYFFDANGYLETTERNGIVDGKFYKDGEVQYNLGLIKYNDGYIYVRSNGEVATGTYWITNTNGLMDAGCYEFDENGYMIIDTSKNGIYDGCYYVDGIKQIGIGLVAYGDSYIYVKTNGELATGAYWVTNVGDTGMSQGLYTFGDDGIMIQ